MNEELIKLESFTTIMGISKDEQANEQYSLNNFEQRISITPLSPAHSPSIRDLKRITEILERPGENRNPKEIKLLMLFTENFPYFQRFKEKFSNSVLHVRFCRLMKLRKLKRAETLFYAGDAADSFYIILKGKVIIYVPKRNDEILEEKARNSNEAEIIDKHLKNLKKNSEIIDDSPRKRTSSLLYQRKSTMRAFNSAGVRKETIKNNLIIKSPIKKEIIEEKGSYFGELGLLTRKPRKGTVLSTEDTYLIYLNKNDYKNVMQSVDQRKMINKIEFFAKFFLKGFTQDGILKLVYFFEKKKFALNQAIYCEGDSVNGCYLIKKGDFLIVKKIVIEEENKKKKWDKFESMLEEEEELKKNEENMKISQLGEGEFFGDEDIIFDNKSRKYNVISKNMQVVAYFINKELFSRILSEKPYLMKIFKNKARNKSLWYLKQIETLISQKNLIKNQFENKDVTLFTENKNKSFFFRTQVEDIVLQKEFRKNSLKKNDYFSSIRGNSINIKNNKDNLVQNDSRSQKIFKLIENNRLYADKVFKTQKPNVHLDIVSSYFNSDRPKSKGKNMQKQKEKINSIIQNSEDNNNINHLVKRVMSATFYGNKSVREKQRINSFFYKTNINHFNNYNEENYLNKINKKKSFSLHNLNNIAYEKDNCLKTIIKPNFSLYEFPASNKTNKLTLNNVGREIFETPIISEIKKNKIIRKTRHNMFFLLNRETNAFSKSRTFS